MNQKKKEQSATNIPADVNKKIDFPANMKYIAIMASVGLVAIDQFIKQWALVSLAFRGRVSVIPGLFYLTYIENRGAAFGIFQGYTAFLTVISLCVLTAALIAILCNKVRTRFLLWSVAIVLAGGAGNCIDRAFRGFVVDYLDFSALFNFPVFNFADCCVVVGTALILLYIIGSEKSAPTPVKKTKSGEV